MLKFSRVKPVLDFWLNGIGDQRYTVQNLTKFA